MKLRQRQDNRGITLVEVIVSMLVLAIIVVPLLGSFVLSSRINLKSRNIQYATTLCQNVMESMKNYDLDEIATQFNGVASGDAFTIVPKTSIEDQDHGIGYYETNEDDTIILDVNDDTHLSEISIAKNDALNEYYYNGNKDKPYYYMIKGVEEGTKRFDVRIKVSSQNYQGAASGSAIEQNKFEFPEVMNLDLNETAVINPSSVDVNYELDGSDNYVYDDEKDTYKASSSSYEKKAFEYFHFENLYYVDNKNSEDTAKGVTPSLSCLSDEDLRKRISRKTIITIEDFESDGMNKIKVTAKLEYKFRGGDGILHDGDDSTNDIVQFGGFYEQVGFQSLNNIYLFHTPLLDGEWDISSSLGDVIEVNNKSHNLGSDLKFFVAQQKTEDGYTPIIPIRVLVSGIDTEKIKFYNNSIIFSPTQKVMLSSADDTKYLLTTDTNYFEDIVTKESAKDRIYEVQVQVYEQDTNVVLSELSSTFTR